MGSSERLCLRWNDFESNIKHGFSELRQDEEFFDVTLACGSRQIKAHKVILSACSPFFRSIIKAVPHQHPLLYLRGIKFNHLESLLSFMYNGEVNVTQEELNSFLAVAEELKIKGLTQNQSNDGDLKPPKSESSFNDAGGPPAKRPRPASKQNSSSPAPSTSAGPRRSRPAASNNEDDDIEEVTPVKSEPKDGNSSNLVVEPEMADDMGGADDYGAGDEDNYDDYGQYGSESGDMSYGEGGSMMDAGLAVAGPSGSADGNKGKSFTDNALSKTSSSSKLVRHDEFDRLIDNLIHKGDDRVFRCTKCNGCATTNKTVARRHVEAKHFVTNGFKCNLCGKICKTRHCLSIHKSKNHKE